MVASSRPYPGLRGLGRGSLRSRVVHSDGCIGPHSDILKERQGQRQIPPFRADRQKLLSKAQSQLTDLGMGGLSLVIPWGMVGESAGDLGR